MKLKIIKPRAQLIGAEKRVQEAYTDFAIEANRRATYYTKQFLIDTWTKETDRNIIRLTFG